jgi:hypothetical protein
MIKATPIFLISEPQSTFHAPENTDFSYAMLKDVNGAVDGCKSVAFDGRGYVDC